MKKIKQFIYSNKDYPIITTLASGLYPLFHYYSNNLDIADTFIQLFYMILLCIGLPFILMILGNVITKISFFSFIKKQTLTAVNLVSFLGLLGLLIFDLNKKELVLVVFVCFISSFLLRKHLNKIVVLQYILFFLSFLTLLPKVYFMINYTDNWSKLSFDTEKIKFEIKPNIYLIQPDGYMNFSMLYEQPYNFTDKTFENYLLDTGFNFFPEFRSNYYSTLTSNSSLFAMKHHYYSNTYTGNLKTYKSQDVIVGTNNVLSILKANNYKTHLLTDNSFFLTNRKLKDYDYCNVPQNKILFYDTGGVDGVDIIEDFEALISKQSNEKTDVSKFYFIEKTIPSHINYLKSNSLGINREREWYFERVNVANLWLKQIINLINRYDENSLVIIAADHGGYVGLNYVKEVEHKKLNDIEVSSVFNSLLAIKWPKDVSVPNIEITSSVNLFRKVFYYLTKGNENLKVQEANCSYIPFYDGFFAEYYECIDDKGNINYKKIVN